MARAGPAQRKSTRIIPGRAAAVPGKPPDLQFWEGPDRVTRCENHRPKLPKAKLALPFVANASEQAHPVHFVPVRKWISPMG